MNSPKVQGQRAELVARKHLEAAGLVFKEANFRSRFGEIDLIFRDKDMLVFVEVRLRSNKRYASASESVGWNKQQKIIKAAQYYLIHHPKLQSCPCRFDVVALESSDPALQQLNWIQNAFQL